MRSIQRLLSEAKGKMNGYVTLLALRYSNLCVKAEATALLPVTVKIGDEELNIEQVADVALPQEDVIAVIPRDPSDLLDIGKGVMKAHPEFKMDIVQNEKSQDEEDKYLTFTMPEVNKTRRDVLNNGVEGLHKQCKFKVDTIFEKYGAAIAEKMVGADPEMIDQVKDKLKELYDFYDKSAQDLTDKKTQEIEEAYQRYEEQQQTQEAERQEEEAAHSQDVGQRLKIEDMGEDEF